MHCAHTEGLIIKTSQAESSKTSLQRSMQISFGLHLGLPHQHLGLRVHGSLAMLAEQSRVVPACTALLICTVHSMPLQCHRL